ncbi:DNA-3-methyladenine glycosylase I [Fodinicurvata halophila]|uniref:DNA-3-methyladenine glycosylase I n=1 Tax=Fodinicurvata halophila TaxID=1419723 RepID=A0ABV8UIY0_9PROT
MNQTRCAWVTNDPLYIAYHDEEWGYPQYDAKQLFETLMLEGFQAGLSWLTILRKREGFRDAFEGFDPERIAEWGPEHVDRLMADPGIVRHRAKIEATLQGARAWAKLMEQHPGGFSGFVWETVEDSPVINRFQDISEVPSQTEASRQLSSRLRKAGFRFTGPTTCYSFMQAAGLVDDHVVTCFRRMPPE